MKTDFEGADRKMTEAQRFKELIQEAYPRTDAVANATARLDEYPFDQDIRYRLRHLLREEYAAWTRVRRCRAVAIHDELLRCAVVADEVCAGSRGTACEAEAVRAARAAWDAYDRARKAMGLGLGVSPYFIGRLPPDATGALARAGLTDNDRVVTRRMPIMGTDKKELGEMDDSSNATTGQERPTSSTQQPDCGLRSLQAEPKQ